MPPDINQSNFTFSPDIKNNAIIYGLRGITRVSSDVIKKIIANRPYDSLLDFLSKNKTNKLQTLNLIKSGAFDTVEQCSREQIMNNYIGLIADKKERLTLQNMQMLINKDLIPKEMEFYKKLFLFNKFLKTCKNGDNYVLNEAAINFIANYFDADLISNGEFIGQKQWDNVYKKAMEPMREYLKTNKVAMLNALNASLFNEVAEKYAKGNISAWEMESINFYYHEHELISVAEKFTDFFKLPETPQIDYSFVNNKGENVNVFKTCFIVGTVIDKDKIRNTVTLLTPTGVVNVKIYKNQFALYDKQLSQRDADGVKHVVEKSWFSRGTKLMVQGFRRGDDFVPRKNKQSQYSILTKIVGIDDNNRIIFQNARAEVDNI